MKRIAIVGTGFSALVLANELKNHGRFEITFFEKSRGVGGRIATRYNEAWEFDHGTPYFEATTPQFIEFLQPLIEGKIIKQWQPVVVNEKKDNIQNTPCFVGTPKMNALPKVLANGFNIKFETKITKMQRTENKWNLVDDKSNQYNSFDYVVTSAPPAQVYDILPNDCSYKNALTEYKMLPAFVGLFGFEQELNINFDVMHIENHQKIEKIVLNHKKDERNNKPSVVVYSSPTYAIKNIETDKKQIEEDFLEELQNLLNIKFQPKIAQVHRWLYCKTEKESNSLFLADSNLQVLSCGDWPSTGTIDGAFLSGIETAKYILEI